MYIKFLYTFSNWFKVYITYNCNNRFSYFSVNKISKWPNMNIHIHTNSSHKNVYKFLFIISNFVSHCNCLKNKKKNGHNSLQSSKITFYEKYKIFLYKLNAKETFKSCFIRNSFNAKFLNASLHRCKYLKSNSTKRWVANKEGKIKDTMQVYVERLCR